MAEQGGAGAADDNGFEKVHHADISPTTPPVVAGPFPHFGGGVEELSEGPGPKKAASSPSAPLVPIVVRSDCLLVQASEVSPGSSQLPTPSASSTDSTALLPGDVGAGASVSKKDGSSASCAGCCDWVKSVDPRVLALVYWRDPRKSGALFASLLVLLLSLAFCSLLSVLAHLSLALLTVTVGIRLYKNVVAAIQKSGEGNPFKRYLDEDLAVSEEQLQRVASQVMRGCLRTLNALKQLFLIDDMIDSLKFGLVLWTLSYVGSWFSGTTLAIIALIFVFTVPKVYEMYKAQIDQGVGLARTKLEAVYKQVREKLPLPGKKKQA